MRSSRGLLAALGAELGALGLGTALGAELGHLGAALGWSLVAGELGAAVIAELGRRCGHEAYDADGDGLGLVDE